MWQGAPLISVFSLEEMRKSGSAYIRHSISAPGIN